MHYTQVELTAPKNRETGVWWLPVPIGKAKVGEKIIRQLYDQAAAPTEDPFYEEEWTISQIGTTLLEEDLRDLIPQARLAECFHRESQTLGYMSM